jgi:hypothetical protein
LSEEEKKGRSIIKRKKKVKKRPRTNIEKNGRVILKRNYLIDKPNEGDKGDRQKQTENFRS